jgi:hypothetical protein
MSKDMRDNSLNQRHQRDMLRSNRINSRHQGRRLHKQSVRFVGEAVNACQTAKRHVGQQLGPARPREIGYDGAGGSVIVSQALQLNFSRTFWITNQRAGIRSRVSRTCSPILRRPPP